MLGEVELFFLLFVAGLIVKIASGDGLIWLPKGIKEYFEKPTHLQPSTNTTNH